MILEPLVRLRAAWRRSVRPHGAWTVFCLALVVWTEVVGRSIDNPTVDALLVGLFVFVGIITVGRHANDPIPWWLPVERLGGRFKRVLESLHVEVGVDLREDPPIPRGWPRPTVVSTAGGLAVLAAEFAFLGLLPTGLRTLGVYTSYTAYLLVLAGLWLVALVGSFFMLVVLVAVIHDAFLRSYTGTSPRPRGREAASVSAAIVAVLAAGLFLDTHHAVAALAGLIVLHVLATLIPGSPPLLLLWRARPEEEPRTVPWDWHMASEPVRIALLVLVLVAAMCGEAAIGAAEAGSSVSHAMGHLLAWCGLAGLVALSAFNFHMAWTARRRDPSGPARPVAHVDSDAGPLPLRERRGIRRALAAHGWDARFAPRPAGRGDVPLLLGDAGAEPPLSWPLPPAWPRRVTAAELVGGETVHVLRRRYEIVQRRLVLRGLERLFKKASSLSFERGTGFWVAPHLWFVLGLTRDEDEESGGEDTGVLEQMIGPRYDRLLPMTARRHFHEVMRGVHLDILFVEDGVDFRRLRAVLRMLFELYDIHGGSMPARARHFTGLPGVRVMIHDYGPDEPFKVEGYPEPDYEGLGRARILHVFKDRGEQDEDVPVDPSRRLEPLLV